MTEAQFKMIYMIPRSSCTNIYDRVFSSLYKEKMVLFFVLFL